jgi:hypothetical protein
MNRPLSLVVDLHPLLLPTGALAFPAHEGDFAEKACEDAVEKREFRNRSGSVLAPV